MAAVAALTLLMIVGRGRTFFFDEWDWVQHRSDGGIDTLLRPHNGHLMPLPVALYRLQFELVGFAPTWPVRFVTALAHVAAAGVLYRLARVRVGVAGGAAAALVFLGLGAAWQTLLLGMTLSFTLATLGVLVAWLALDRNTRAADVTACVALLVAAASFSVGPIFAVAVAAELAASRRLGQAWWVPAVPLGLFAVAYLAYGDGGVIAADAWETTSWALEAAAVAAGGLAVLGPSWGFILLAVLLTGAVVITVRRRATPRLVGLLVAGVLFWMLTGASRSSGLHIESPRASRYIEFGAPIILLVAVELCQGRRLTGWWRVPVGAAVVLCLWRGVSELVDQGALLRENSEMVLAGIAAMELARPYVDPNLIPLPAAAPQIRAEDYFRAADRTRSSATGDPATRLRVLSEDARMTGDALLAEIELRGTPVPVDPDGCRDVRGDELVELVELEPGADVQIVATTGFVELYARRFAAGFPSAPSMRVAPFGATRVAVAADRAARPWQFRASSPSPFWICPP